MFRVLFNSDWTYYSCHMMEHCSLIERNNLLAPQKDMDWSQLIIPSEKRAEIEWCYYKDFFSMDIINQLLENVRTSVT